MNRSFNRSVNRSRKKINDQIKEHIKQINEQNLLKIFRKLYAKYEKSKYTRSVELNREKFKDQDELNMG